MANQPKIPLHKDGEDVYKSQIVTDAQLTSDSRKAKDEEDELVESFPGVKAGAEKRVLGIAEQMELEELEEARLKMENRLKEQIGDEKEESKIVHPEPPTGKIKPRDDYEYKNLWM